jgi:hypothetical protein
VNERLDSLLYDIQDVMAAKGNPRSEKVDVDLDEAYVFNFLSFFGPLGLLTGDV